MKRYVRKGVPNEHRARIWMAASGAQERLERNPGYYQALLSMEHDTKLKETIHTGANKQTLHRGHFDRGGQKVHLLKYFFHFLLLHTLTIIYFKGN